ncbi:MAG: UDP-N-acetylmuramoyl-tripeptide--D-alanyl-D-alanine ligase [Burkholderiales bacterium]
MMDTTTAAQLTGGRRVGTNAMFRRVTTDTRELRTGDLFVAIAGERFDGHDFVAAALAGGASAAMVDDAHARSLTGNLVAVADTRAALAALAAAWRRRFTLPLVVVTGSNGKTTVKEMTAAILRAHYGDEEVLATRGNFNNDIGLPLTLLGLRASHRAAVIELGMNHRGETRTLAALAQPTIALVNNAQREHQEFMKGVAEVADEHADAVLALREGGIAVINADDPYCRVWRDAAERRHAKVVGFALDAAAEVRGQASLGVDGSDLDILAGGGHIHARIAVPGAAMARNALAATAAAMAAGAGAAAVTRGLGAFRPVKGRLATRHSNAGATIIDDTYNANPDSVREGIDVLARAHGSRWLVLGDMGEVGAQGPRFHREIGEYARAAGIDRLLAAGRQAHETVLAFGAHGAHYADVDALVAALSPPPDAATTVLVKGSRFMRMERVVDALCAAGTDDTAGGH